MLDFLLTATPTSDLPSDWALYIILTLIGFIGSIFLSLKWIIGIAAKKTDSIVKDVKDMHSTGINEIKSIRESQIITESSINEIKTDNKEIKYAIQTLNTKVRCRESA